MRYLFQNQRGATALFLTVLILAAVTTITFAGSQIILANLRISRERYDSTRAYFAAESGAEKILWGIRKTDPPLVLADVPCADFSRLCFDANEFDVSFPCVEDWDTCAASGKEDHFNLAYGAAGNATGDALYYYDGAGTTTLTTVGHFRDVGRQIQLRY